MPRWPFPTKALLKSSLLILFGGKLPEHVPTKTQLRELFIIDQYAIYVHAWAHRWFAHTQLSSLYPLCHSPDKLFQALYHFSLLQATESWVGPGNKANVVLKGHFT